MPDDRDSLPARRQAPALIAREHSFVSQQANVSYLWCKNLLLIACIDRECPSEGARLAKGRLRFEVWIAVRSTVFWQISVCERFGIGVRVYARCPCRTIDFCCDVSYGGVGKLRGLTVRLRAHRNLRSKSVSFCTGASERSVDRAARAIVPLCLPSVKAASPADVSTVMCTGRALYFLRVPCCHAVCPFSTSAVPVKHERCEPPPIAQLVPLGVYTLSSDHASNMHDL